VIVVVVNELEPKASHRIITADIARTPAEERSNGSEAEVQVRPEVEVASPYGGSLTGKLCTYRVLI